MKKVRFIDVEYHVNASASLTLIVSVQEDQNAASQRMIRAEGGNFLIAAQKAVSQAFGVELRMDNQVLKPVPVTDAQLSAFHYPVEGSIGLVANGVWFYGADSDEDPNRARIKALIVAYQKFEERQKPSG